MICETKRLIIRRFKLSDWQDMYLYCSQEGVGERAGWLPHRNMSETLFMLLRFIDHDFCFALELKETQTLIGHVSFASDKETPWIKEIGFVLNRDYHRKGLMSEAVAALLAYMKEAGYSHIEASCFVDNEASRALLEKLGFIYQGEELYYFKNLGDSHLIRNYLLVINEKAE